MEAHAFVSYSEDFVTQGEEFVIDAGDCVTEAIGGVTGGGD